MGWLMKSYKTKNMNLQLFAGNEITDLTGTSWVINNDFTATAGYGQFDLFITKIVDGGNIIEDLNGVGGYDSLNIGYSLDPDMPPVRLISSANSFVWMNALDTWTTEFTIGGGTDATNQSLITWLTNNATQVITGYSSTISLTNCTCNKSNETGLIGSYSTTITANDGYYLSSVTSTLGTVEIATNLKTATITISDVTEDFTISGIGTEIGKLDIILHPNNNGVTDYTKEILPKVKTASTLEINRLFRTRYTITKTIINGSASGDTNIWSEETAQVTITPDENYNLPSTITVINANNTYNNENGVVSLSNATGNVTISATCESAAWGGTDLTGTSWLINDNGLSKLSGFGSTFSINFNINDNSYTYFFVNGVKSQLFTIEYNGIVVFDEVSGWILQSYRTINITGGTDAINPTLMTWLQSNATLISW